MPNKQNIVVVFLCLSFGPVGGFKVIYEYANRLVRDGWCVTCVYPLWGYPNKTVMARIKMLFIYAISVLRGRKNAGWFPLVGVRNHIVWSLNSKYPGADVYIATAVETAYALREKAPNIIKSKKWLYFIQDYEDFSMQSELVDKSYIFQEFKKIVISDWLKDKVEKAGGKATVIPNGFDFTCFHKDVDFNDKKRYEICMLYHILERKGCKDALEALYMVKEEVPLLHVSMFGFPSAPSNLPDWISYYRCPAQDTLNRLYNEASVFVAASHEEGWGLTVGEAMICGAAVVCTDNGGFREMCRNGETALMSPIKNPALLAQNILYLLKDDNLRLEIARRGNKHIQRFTWEESYKDLKKILDDVETIRIS